MNSKELESGLIILTSVWERLILKAYYTNSFVTLEGLVVHGWNDSDHKFRRVIDRVWIVF